MSKCQKNKYAAGGKCGSMSNSAGSLLQPSVSGSDHAKNPEQVGCKPLATFGEVSSNLAALLATREKQDLLFNTSSQNSSQAIILKKVISKSDIDTVLEGDF